MQDGIGEDRLVVDRLTTHSRDLRVGMFLRDAPRTTNLTDKLISTNLIILK